MSSTNSNPSITAFRYPIGLSLNPDTAPISIGLSTSTEESVKNAQNELISIVSQSSPTWVLTFVRWKIRDTLRTSNSDPQATVEKLIIENDCINLNVSDNKAVLTPNMTAVLKGTDVNYADAIHPGDFVLVNILNWESDARNIAFKAKNNQPINEQSDGFKGVFKVQSVRKMVAIVDPNTGIKTVVYKIDGYAFTEFNNIIYFNPNLVLPQLKNNVLLYLADLTSIWTSLINKKGATALQEIIAILIQIIIGSGINSKARKVNGAIVSANIHFLVPKLLGQLLGVGVAPLSANASTNPIFSGAATANGPTIAAKDIYYYIFGIQNYSGGQRQNLTDGMNPSNIKLQKYPRFWYTDQNCAGNSILKPEYWNQVQLWSIINQYTNSPLNELYSCFRISPDTGRIMPTLVFRQIPFTSEDYLTQKLNKNNTNPITRYLTLPRWVLHSGLVYKTDLGTDEAARINFVQYYAKSTFSIGSADISLETAKENYIFDQDDVTRSGLRPYVVQNQFDDIDTNNAFASPGWARILGDALIGGHLKINGSIECMGVVEPVAVGDNLEFDGVVYHIEQISHDCTINPVDGKKSFRTTFRLSHGVSLNSSTQGTQYSQMTFPDAYADRINDYKNEQILPGISENQDVITRNTSVEPINTSGSNNSSFQQPTIIKNNTVTGE